VVDRVEIRQLARTELSRVGEIDRTEHGIGVVVPHLRPAVAQLAFIHVTQAVRAAGIGSRLCAEMDRVARDAGDTAMVVSATPSANTVRFYRSRGFEPMAEPLSELLELEPEDVHMHKTL
jgi:GNAT superfamily N-acetyltransferase